MVKGLSKFRISCHGCQHFFVTYDPRRPWGCRRFGFKGKNLPAQTVYEATGMQCAYYLAKLSVRELRKKPQNKRPGEVDIRG